MIDSLSVVIPCWNEAQNIGRVAGDCVAMAERVAERFEIIVVDDGSDDGTAEIVDGLAAADGRIVALHHPENRGIAAATQSGFAAARHDFVFYVDGDGQFDVREIDLLLPYCRDFDLVVGRRANRADPWHRRWNARLYNGLLRRLFHLRVRDVNCAFKLLRREVLARLDCRSTSAFYLAELLIRAQRAGLEIREVAVRHYPRRFETPSGARPGVVLKALRDLLLFWLREGAAP